MKTESYYHELGATAGCTLRLGVRTNALPRSRSIFMGNSWFDSVKAAAATAEKGMEGIYQFKLNHELYSKDFIEDSLDEAPGGTHIVMQGTHPDGVELIAVGYHYNPKVTLCLVVTKNAGSTSEGESYEMKFIDDYGNIHVRFVSWPALISHSFNSSNYVDKHNQARQYEIGFEKKWETRDL